MNHNFQVDFNGNIAQVIKVRDTDVEVYTIKNSWGGNRKKPKAKNAV
jgi:hypothetical protein